MRLLALLACTGSDTDWTPPEDTADEGVANIVSDTRSVEFGMAEDINERLRATLVMRNTGTGVLDITDVVSDGPFTSSTTAVSLQPGSTTQLTLTFEADVYVEEIAGSLTFVSNDPDTPELMIDMLGGVVLDGDGDGYNRMESEGGDDCDDEDDTVHPGAEDRWYDGVDSNCEGDDDYDQDKDGYSASAYGGEDCNDIQDFIYPGAPDEWYDGVDSDCAGNDDHDQDYDGWGSKAEGAGSDCDDFDDTKYPGATEYLNGVKDDCSGEGVDVDVTVEGADLSWIGGAASHGVGSSVLVDDLDGDGSDDWLIAAAGYDSGNGAVYVLDGASTMPSDMTDVTTGAHSSFTGSSEGLGATARLMGDWDGDGLSEVALGAPSYGSSRGRIYIIDGDELMAYGDTSDAHSVITGEAASSTYSTNGLTYMGQSMGAADLNGDGLQDLHGVFSPNSGYYYYKYTYTFIQYGDSSGWGSMDASDMDAWYTVREIDDDVEKFVQDGGDLDNDGYDDIVMCNPLADWPTSYAGSAWVMWGDSTEYSDTATAASGAFGVTVGGDTYRDGVGAWCNIVDDLNGDGFDELMVYSDSDSAMGVWYGSSTFSADVSSAEMDDADQWIDIGQPDWVRNVGDMNGDGNDEVAWAINSSATDSVFFLDVVGGADEVIANDALASIATGADQGSSSFGSSIVTGKDLDGDGQGDLIIGDPGFLYDLDGDGTDEDGVGSLHVFYLPSY